MKKFYRVLFTVKKGGERDYVFDIEAHNAKEAKEETKKYWEEHRAEAHLFGLYANKVELANYEYARFPKEISRKEYNEIYMDLSKK